MAKNKKSKIRSKLINIPLIGGLFKAKDRIVSVKLSGVIAAADGGYNKKYLNINNIEEQLEKAFETFGAKAVAITINSPGGSPVQSDLIAKKMRELSDKHELPIYIFVEDVAASGGYWLACAGDKIYACESSIIGSIGVISASFGFENFIKKHGVERRIYTSGTSKSFLDPFSPAKEADIKRLKTLQNEIHDNFKNWVKLRRKDKINEKSKTLFTGEFWTGIKALELGLIDGIGNMETVIKSEFGDDCEIVKIDPPKKSFISSLLSSKINSNNVTEDVIDYFESKSFWSRFGL